MSPTGAATQRARRDTLFLLAVIAWTLLPQLPHLPAWCIAFTAAALLWRGLLAWRGAPLPGRALLLAALAVAAAGTLWSHQSLLGRDAGITLLVLLTALKTLELRARRDAVVVFFLGFLLVLAAFLRSQSLAIALAMALSVLGLLMALLLAHRPAGQPRLAEVAGQVLRQALWGTPLVLLLFLFFPRLPPLWGLPGEALARSGLSDEMQLGQVAELIADERLAMRVDFLGAPLPPPERLYFRGPVLRRYDGQRWRADDGGLGPLALAWPGAPARAPAPSLPYLATLEPSRLASLPLLEDTLALPQVDGLDSPPLRRDDLHWVTRQPLAERVRVRAEASLAPRRPDTLGPADRQVKADDLALPPGAHPRLRAWAAALRAEAPLAQAPEQDFAARASDRLLAHIRSAGFTYSLAPGRSADADLLDGFWLDHREGFCEHFAAAYVVAMRALGVPARIVTGYQGGSFNPVAGVLELRHSDAHAWAEIWLPGRGWQRVDPTAAVAPERIRAGQRLRPPPGLVAGTLAQVDPALFERLRSLWGVVDHRWNEWVLQYGRQRQQDLLQRLGWTGADALGAAQLLLGGLGLLGLGGALWAAWDGWRQRQRDPWLRRLQQIQQELQRRGLPDAARLPARSLAGQVLHHWGPAAAPLADLLRQLDAQRYGPAGAAGPAQRALRRALRALPAPRR